MKSQEMTLSLQNQEQLERFIFSFILSKLDCIVFCRLCLCYLLYMKYWVPSFNQNMYAVYNATSNPVYPSTTQCSASFPWRYSSAFSPLQSGLQNGDKVPHSNLIFSFLNHCTFIRALKSHPLLSSSPFPANKWTEFKSVRITNECVKYWAVWSSNRGPFYLLLHFLYAEMKRLKQRASLRRAGMLLLSFIISLFHHLSNRSATCWPPAGWAHRSRGFGLVRIVAWRLSSCLACRNCEKTSAVDKSLKSVGRVWP